MTCRDTRKVTSHSGYIYIYILIYIYIYICTYILIITYTHSSTINYTLSFILAFTLLSLLVHNSYIHPCSFHLSTKKGKKNPSLNAKTTFYTPIHYKTHIQLSFLSLFCFLTHTQKLHNFPFCFPCMGI